MFELTINNEVYEFHFGMLFLRELDKTVSVPVDGMPGTRANVGMRYTIAKVIDGDLTALSEILLLANKGKKPRLTQAELDQYIESEDTDIDKLFEDVINFFERANVSKRVTRELKGMTLADPIQE